VITAVDWRGELDGELVLTIDDEQGGSSEVVIDRPGDLVSRMMVEEFAEESLLDVAAMFGYCLASRGIEEPIFVDQIVAKIGLFLRSARMESMPLFRLTERVAELVRESGAKGIELRRVLFEEAQDLAHRFRNPPRVRNQ
jgi:hypothetical protein